MLQRLRQGLYIVLGAAHPTARGRLCSSPEEIRKKLHSSWKNQFMEAPSISRPLSQVGALIAAAPAWSQL